MNKLGALLLGAVLSVSLSPIANAQSLSLGSLDSTTETPPEPPSPVIPWPQDPDAELKEWTEGVAYNVLMFDPSYPGRGPLCGINLWLHTSSALNVPEGTLLIRDAASGTELDNPSYGPGVFGMHLVDYPGPDFPAMNASWFGTTRKLEFFIVGEDDTRTRLGETEVHIPETCTVSEGGSEFIATGWVAP